ncbi:SUMF1/EgtB/PvdO family nonheme iron enzyme [Calothrix sp. FACHB-156]|nr:SUMF1/EgtB/PvdO family nonheme iron enzyme [Calothrix sp. FACHB-156]
MGKNWAVVIGINKYDYLSSLKYAQRDAETIRDYCQNQLGFDKVYYFSDDAPPIKADRGPDFKSIPTYGYLRRFLKSRFKNPSPEPIDNLWFFFAGHGKLFERRDYLMLRDSDPQDISKTAISVHEIVNDYLRISRANNIVLMLDACRDEGSRSGEGISLEKHQGIITMYSCSLNQYSYEIDQLQQGSFTYTLLQGLQTLSQDNDVTVQLLDKYLCRHVPQLNQQYSKPIQTPYTAIEPLTKKDTVLVVSRNSAIASSEPLSSQSIAISESAEISTTTPVILPINPQTSRSFIIEFETATVNIQGQITARQKDKVRYRAENLGNNLRLEMLLIPSDRFMMGSADSEIGRQNNESPQHQVSVGGFLMSKYPVTQAQWTLIANLPKVNLELDPNPSYFSGEKLPVEQISWYEAVEFCTRLSIVTKRAYRLPSEAEWEYACRANTLTPFHFGQIITTDLANFNVESVDIYSLKGEYRGQTTEVGYFQFTNSFGLYDMHGNVGEWCLDNWHDNYNDAPNNGSAWTEGGDDHYRVSRGGCWSLYAKYCRCANRTKIEPDKKSSCIGFRVVCSSIRSSN